MAERDRTIDEITADLESVQTASAKANEAVEARRKELIRAQTAAIGWSPDYPSPYAASILAFAQENGLDPTWLGSRAGSAMHEVTRDNKLDMNFRDARTSEEHYRVGIYRLGQDHHASSQFTQIASAEFRLAQQAAEIEEQSRPDDVDPQARNSLFYKFLAKEFTGDLKQIVHDHYWNNY